MSQKHRSLYIWSAIVILLIGFWLRLWKLTETSLWLDEFFTNERANASSIAETIDLTAQHASQMPFYYIMIQPLPTDHRPAIYLAYSNPAGESTQYSHLYSYRSIPLSKAHSGTAGWFIASN